MRPTNSSKVRGSTLKAVYRSTSGRPTTAPSVPAFRVFRGKCRVAQIGRNRPKRQRSGETNNQNVPAQSRGELDDEIPF